MKNLITLFAMSLLVGLSSLNAQVYVHANASGANNGSSWADAYTLLSTAISNAPANGEIWVAEGTYIPNTPTGRAATFRINKNIKLYGGFAGTETQLSERNPQAHITLLSGDVNGDDSTNNGLLLNRSDNVYNIMEITGGPDSTAIIDGFTFMGGYADGSSLEDQSGGAIHTEGDMLIRNCIFRDNYCANIGGALLASGGTASGVRITNCRFEKNLSNQYGGAMYISFVPSFQVDSCDFVENRCLDGTGNGGGVGGAANVENSSGTFLGNLFSQNTALATGGGLLLFFNINQSHHLTVSQCTFSENMASYGGGMYLFANGKNDNFQILDCEFTGNSASSELLELPNASGGGMSLAHSNNTDASGNNILIENCQYTQNSATYNGGGIHFYNGDGQNNGLDVINCRFSENTAGFSGGGMLVTTPHDDNHVSVDRCHFDKNFSAIAMAFGVGRENSLSISPQQVCTIKNSLFTENNDPENPNFVLGVYYARIALINSTIANNMGDGVVTLVSGEYRLQNNILYNPGFQEYVSDGVVNPMALSISSDGGNVVRDGSMEAWLKPGQDLSSTDPLFEAGSFQLSFNSPAVDLGTSYPGYSSTDKDAAGNARLQGKNIDAGAYESSFTTTIKDLLLSKQVLHMYPNPVSSLTTLKLDNTWRGQLQLRIFNLQGQLVMEQTLNKLQLDASWKLDLAHLAPGTYKLVMIHGKEAAVKSFVKK